MFCFVHKLAPIWRFIFLKCLNTFSVPFYDQHTSLLVPHNILPFSLLSSDCVDSILIFLNRLAAATPILEYNKVSYNGEESYLNSLLKLCLPLKVSEQELFTRNLKERYPNGYLPTFPVSLVEPLLNMHTHWGMFPISSVQVIPHKLPRKTIIRLGDVLFWLVNYYLQRRKILQRGSLRHDLVWFICRKLFILRQGQLSILIRLTI